MKTLHSLGAVFSKHQDLHKDHRLIRGGTCALTNEANTRIFVSPAHLGLRSQEFPYLPSIYTDKLGYNYILWRRESKMKPYKPSNQIDQRGWQWLAITSGVGGITLGGFAFVTSFFVYLVIILPVLLGLVAGALLRESVYRGKVRNPLIASGFALITGAAVYGTMHGADYLVFRQNATQEISRALKSIEKSSEKASQSKAAGMTVDKFLQERTGARGFTGFLRYRSQTGIVVNRSSLRIPVPAQITWNYWGLEFLITSAIALSFAYGAARKPFCESCHSWYSLSHRLGRVKYPNLSEFLAAIEQQTIPQDSIPQAAIPPAAVNQAETNQEIINQETINPAGSNQEIIKLQVAPINKLLAPLAKVYPPSLEVHLQGCASCQGGDGILVLSQAGVNKNGVIKLAPYSTGVISPEQAMQLTQSVRESLTGRGASFGEPNPWEPNQIWQQVASAQKERSTIDKKSLRKFHKKSDQESIYTSPHLSPEQLADLQHQLAQHPQIKQAYLVEKVVQTLPEIPFYLLGIIRKRNIIESATAQTEWESKFGNALEFAEDFAVVILNGDRKLQKIFQQIEDSVVYTYVRPVKTPEPVPSES